MNRKKDMSHLMPETITFCFYTILHHNRTVHLSFDRKKHLKALSYIKKNSSSQDGEASIKKLTKKDLRNLLIGNMAEFPLAEDNPFLEKGTVFQRRVWQLISAIPFGETRTYGDLALSLGRISLARAVGRACNANPLALFIPCHRVTAKNSPGGFAGGSDMKKVLLELEATF